MRALGFLRDLFSYFKLLNEFQFVCRCDIVLCLETVEKRPSLLEYGTTAEKIVLELNNTRAQSINNQTMPLRLRKMSLRPP